MIQVAAYRIRYADWTRDYDALVRVRFEVFVQEQNVPEDMEIDAIDPQCIHAIAEDEAGHAVGTGRLLPDGHIGRMAVSRNAHANPIDPLHPFPQPI